MFSFASVYFVNEIVAPTEKVRGQALAALCGLGGISNIIGASLGGLMIDSLGINALLSLFAGFSFLGFAVMAAISFLLRRRKVNISVD